MILAEWHQSPEHVNRKWTEEELLVLIDARNRKIRKMRAKENKAPKAKRVSDKQLFASMGIVPSVVRTQ